MPIDDVKATERAEREPKCHRSSQELQLFSREGERERWVKSFGSPFSWLKNKDIDTVEKRKREKRLDSRLSNDR